MHKEFDSQSPLSRVRIFYAALGVVMAVFLIRLFYLQVIKHDYYKNSAQSGQFKEYQIPAKRGVIEAQNGDETVPIVLNEIKYTLFADPVYVKDKESAAEKIDQFISASKQEIIENLEKDTRYSVLAKKLDADQKSKIEELDIKGIGLREESYRTYPQGEMAASLLGFVNDEGEGKYGIEQALNDQLKGVPGELNAITDAQGVPLVSNPENVIKEGKDGERVILTIDMSMQQQLEAILKDGLEKARSDSGGAFIMDVNTGAIKAMANFPTYNPGEFFNVEDARVFNNSNVSNPYEIGSVMKPLTMAAALDNGSVQPGDSFYDSGIIEVDNEKITNVEESGGAGTRTLPDILRLSLNTGATWLLSQMGGGTINDQARNTWHKYMVERYGYSQQTGIEQGYEAEGIVPDPNDGYGLNIQYANTSFGQGMTATPVQVGAALASVINGGTYYQPRLVESIVSPDGTRTDKDPIIKRTGVVSPVASDTVRENMINVINSNHRVYGFNLRPEYMVGGKTGTAQIPKPEGGYYENKYNGTFTGFVGGDSPEYVIVVRTNEPNVPGYAGSKAAGPIFSAAATMLIDNFGVLPRSN
ncbi:penicillin-binding protein 2 [Candidatus Saccharibacteria bacterium]|nr:penicillin-binding protein 2 [Candidatus Saccharibacteria bacterium]